MKKLLSIILLVGSVGVLVGLSQMSAGAAATSNTSGSGYRVSPVRSDLTIAPGTSQTVTVYVQNVASVPENVQVIINDFQAAQDESGRPELLLNGQNTASHGLKQYISLPISIFSLQPNEQRAVAVKVTIPLNTAGGGYFGAVRFAPASLTSGENVNLAPSVASLILVTVPGKIQERLSIASFDVRNGDHPQKFLLSGKNLQAVARFQNSGNLQEEPFGKVLLKRGNTVLGSYEINNSDPRGNVLPNSIRRFSVALPTLHTFGKYTVEGNFGYGSTGQLLSASTTFYLIPLLDIILVLVVILVLLFAIFGLPRLLRAYNQRIIQRANRRQ